MDFLIGIVGDGFVLTAADCSQARSVVVMKKNMDKMLPLSDHCLMLTAGPVGDCTNFGEYIQKNLKLNEMRNGFEATTWSSANFVRRQLADALRSRSAYQVNLLVAGVDDTKGAQLYYMDYLAAMASIPFAAHGYGSFFTLATLDRHYRPGMNLEEAKDLLRKCIAAVQTRFIINMESFKVRYVDAEGIHEIENFE